MNFTTQVYRSFHIYENSLIIRYIEDWKLYRIFIGWWIIGDA